MLKLSFVFIMIKETGIECSYIFWGSAFSAFHAFGKWLIPVYCAGIAYNPIVFLQRSRSIKRGGASVLEGRCDVLVFLVEPKQTIL